MGVLGGVTISTSGCGEEGGVKRRGDSAMRVDIRIFANRAREGNSLRGEYGGVVVAGRKGEGSSREGAIDEYGQRRCTL